MSTQQPPCEDLAKTDVRVEVKKRVVNIKCRNSRCDSITAVEIEIRMESGQRLYQCTKCGRPVAVNVGGSFNL